MNKNVIATWNIPGDAAREYSFYQLMQGVMTRWPHLAEAQRWQQDGHWYLTLEEEWDYQGDVLIIEAVAYCDRQTMMIWDILTA
jgi:hypothetical protein